MHIYTRETKSLHKFGKRKELTGENVEFKFVEYIVSRIYFSVSVNSRVPRTEIAPEFGTTGFNNLL